MMDHSPTQRDPHDSLERTTEPATEPSTQPTAHRKQTPAEEKAPREGHEAFHEGQEENSAPGEAASALATASPTTPLMRQYSAIKKEHPNALLFFRLGDFYELFFEDANLAARELQITLTSRNKEKGIPVPMCGVPYHAA